MIENEFKKLQTFDSRLFIGQTYFGNDGSQNFSIFQPIYKTLTTLSGLPNTIAEWESKGLSNKKIKSAFAAAHTLSPKLVWMNNSRIRIEFKRSCLKQDKVTFTPNNVVNLLIAYELGMVTRLTCWIYSKTLIVWSC